MRIMAVVKGGTEKRSAGVTQRQRQGWKGRQRLAAAGIPAWLGAEVLRAPPPAQTSEPARRHAPACSRGPSFPPPWAEPLPGSGLRPPRPAWKAPAAGGEGCSA